MSTQVTGPCKISFYWAVSSEEGFDFLRFFINGVEHDKISGGGGWTREAYVLPAGTHTLTWTYTKDDFVSAGFDIGLVDQFAIHHDNDGDGIHSDLESWFGTSDGNPADFPRTTVARGGGGTTLTFPSVAGKDYLVQYSDDLKEWKSVLVTATGTITTWTDLNATSKTHRFYRVEIP